MVQVNISCSVDGAHEAYITSWPADGYTGRLIDTQYLDGADTTNWNVFHGTREECEQWIADHRHELWKYS